MKAIALATPSILFLVRSKMGLFACAAALLLTSLAPSRAVAQGPSQREVEEWLNQVDSPSQWQQMPRAQAMPQRIAPPSQQAQSFSKRTTSIPERSAQYKNNLPQWKNNPLAQIMIPTQMRRQLPARQMMPAGQNPFKLTRQDILRIFLGGDLSNSQGNSQAVYGVRENLQRASNEAEQAESASSRAGYEGDRDSRLSAASEAQNHANAARAAADEATSEAASGTSEAKDAAASARAEADRAQAAADRAHASAEGALW